MRALLMAVLISGAAFAVAEDSGAATLLPGSNPKLSQVAQTAAQKEMIVTVPTANLREQPTTKSKVLTKLKQGTKVDVISTSGYWVRVNANNVQGYVSSRLVK